MSSGGFVNGLFLKREEIHLFPASQVSPLVAVGWDKPQDVLSYQLSARTCPHLGASNECSIHNDRPLVCRAFPFEYHQKPGPDGLNWSGSYKCPVVRENGVRHKGPGLALTVLPSDLEGAVDLFYYHWEQRAQFAGKLRWVFDLELKDWLPVGWMQHSRI
jgi:Fe-S-cluster containining protein